MASEAPLQDRNSANAGVARRGWLAPPAGYKWRRGTTISFLVFHALLPLLLVPWLFSWEGVIAMAFSYYLFNTVGIDVCYHRLLSHRSYKVPLWLERLFALFGVCSLQDSPTQWAATHRRHHRHADGENDPHSPLESPFWGHIGWLIVKEGDLSRGELQQKYVADLLRDPFYRRLEKNTLSIWIFAAHAVLFFVGGFVAGFARSGTAMGGLQLGASLFVWGVIGRIVYSWHATWSVNSIAHLWGYRNYKTGDNSQNNWLLSLLNNGGGWHNNHHADQRSAAHGHHRWWEIDVAYLTIFVLATCRIAWDVTPRRRLHLMVGGQEEQPSETGAAATLPFPGAAESMADADGDHDDLSRAA